jgi:hypothetical protein
MAWILVLCLGATIVTGKRWPTYKPDSQTTAVVFPEPETITASKSENPLYFHECMVRYEYSTPELGDVTDIYEEVTFGENHKRLCEALEL